ncbi:uncharacterized protein NPIL_100501 [Nephila pilipes]|uniref:Uncharacterized protein n=1 Tax=Nephila pilipes TaxID=299642 RepID=A0A8X6IEG3_NEPPI|nr:uncharacterized protein NPIL_100501 [Nephila pilipes]
MTSILQVVFTVALVVLCTTSFKPVICQDYDESLYRPSIVIATDVLPDDQVAIVVSCVDGFHQEVENSEALKNLFDLSQVPALLVEGHVKEYFESLFQSLGAKRPDKIADLTTRPMRNNFPFYSGAVLLRDYSNFLCIYAYSEGVLTQGNARDFGLQFANFFEESTGSPNGIGEGLDKSIKSISPLTVEKGIELGNYYNMEWLLTAVETQNSTNLFYKCSFEADGDPN